ncbi:hypothetical protein [Mesorhizobium sp. B4-1-1]|uniref:hypothetical protein n=1 Tax=Mesorhizobium sp. B4-1-1 TaxID=2589890 RepID=UPI0011283AF4|nr:hypothetical protein [Mesorhizobium sp. B4-1-1]TPI19800.1 hypothetical protein FJW10_13720 [Mesorhizobium sp. B4-1-1]
MARAGGSAPSSQSTQALFIASTITVFEPMGAANLVRAQTFRVYEPLFAAAPGYFLLAGLVMAGFGFVERRFARRY